VRGDEIDGGADEGGDVGGGARMLGLGLLYRVHHGNRLGLEVPDGGVAHVASRRVVLEKLPTALRHVEAVLNVPQVQGHGLEHKYTNAVRCVYIKMWLNTQTNTWD
jgi:hypothetical protein